MAINYVFYPCFGVGMCTQVTNGGHDLSYARSWIAHHIVGCCHYDELRLGLLSQVRMLFPQFP